MLTNGCCGARRWIHQNYVEIGVSHPKKLLGTIFHANPKNIDIKKKFKKLSYFYALYLDSWTKINWVRISSFCTHLLETFGRGELYASE